MRSRIGEHAAHLLLEHGGLAQAIAARELEQLVVRDAAPKEEREPRRELVVVERIAALRRSGRVALEAEHELRARQDSLQPGLDTLLETAFRVALRVEIHEHGNVLRGRRLAIRAIRERGQNLTRT